MKKNAKRKITLSKETLQHLDAEQTGRAAGGSWWSCPNSCLLECYFSMPNEASC